MPKKWQWIIILIGNVVFYLFAGFEFLLFLVFSIVSTFLLSLWINKRNQKTNDTLENSDFEKEDKKKIKKKNTVGNQWIVALGIILNLALLVVAKYGNTVLDAFRLLSNEDFLGSFKFILPIGLSFYTFSSIGYLIDSYREVAIPEKNIFKYAAFISFFPIVLQGPLCSYSDVGKQVIESHDFDPKNAISGFKRMILGFFKKIVIADLIAVAVSSLWANYTEYSGLVVFLGAVFFAIQIYFDFSGFMDISIGIAKIMGIKLPENFDAPYFSTSVAQYWRRWHITLGAWFRNYLYYPLMRSPLFTKIRKKTSRKVGDRITVSLSLAVVWISIGLWHGSTLNFLVHGCYYGLILILDVLLGDVYKKIKTFLRIKDTNKAFIAFQMIRTFVLVCWGYFLFASPSLDVGVHMFVSSLKFWDFSSFAKMSELGLPYYGYIIVFAGILVSWLCMSLFRDEVIGKFPYFKYNLSKIHPAIQILLLVVISGCTVAVLIYEMSLGDFSSSSMYFNF